MHIFVGRVSATDAPMVGLSVAPCIQILNYNVNKTAHCPRQRTGYCGAYSLSLSLSVCVCVCLSVNKRIQIFVDKLIRNLRRR